MGSKVEVVSGGDAPLTIVQAAEYLNVSTTYMRRLVWDRRVAHHRHGRAIRINRSDLDAYKASCRVEPVEVS